MERGRLTWARIGRNQPPSAVENRNQLESCRGQADFTPDSGTADKTVASVSLCSGWRCPGGSADGSAISSVVRFPARSCSPLLALTCIDGR